MFKQILETENNSENRKKITSKYYEKVLPFYMSHGKEFVLKANSKKISCRLFINPNAKAKIIIVNGYNESYLKYAEVIYDLYQQGYSVYAYDHQGQGFSQKFPNQNNRGFMDSFDGLVNDFQVFFNFVDNHDKKLNTFVLAHSMGGTVCTLAVCQNKIHPNRIVLSAPMFGIALTPVPMLEYPIYVLSRTLCELGFAHTYAFGQTDCFPLKTFEKNKVTHSRARHEIWQKHVRETPDIQMGGPTFQWIRESVHASRIARTMGKENKIPILLLQAENDIVVRNDMQNTFLTHCANSEKKVIGSAKHEILMEIDSLRNQTFEYILNFFA